MTIARSNFRLFRQQVREIFWGQVRWRTQPDVTLFFGGGPFLRFPQKWGFFRAVQLQTGANSYTATSTCRLGPIAVLVRALAYGRVFPQADRGACRRKAPSEVSG